MIISGAISIILLFLIVYPIILYPLVLVIGAKFAKRKKMKKNEKVSQPSVSIIVPMYNEERMVRKKIENCLGLLYPAEQIEIILGSDGSIDSTNKLLNEYKSHPNIKLVFSDRIGKSRLLNKLASIATGDILVLTDADTELDADAISNSMNYFIDDSVGAICGNLRFRSVDGVVREAGYWKYETALRRLESEIYSTIVVSGSLFVMKRSLYEMLPEDVGVADDLSIPLSILEKRKRILFAPDVAGDTPEADKLKDEYFRRLRIASLNYQSIKYYLHMLHPRQKFISFALWSHKILRWLTPIFLILFFLFAYLSRDVNMFFDVLWKSQLIFYGLVGIMGLLLHSKNRKSLLIYPYYFIAMNVALLHALILFVFGKHQGKWDVVRN